MFPFRERHSDLLRREVDGQKGAGARKVQRLSFHADSSLQFANRSAIRSPWVGVRLHYLVLGMTELRDADGRYQVSGETPAPRPPGSTSQVRPRRYPWRSPACRPSHAQAAARPTALGRQRRGLSLRCGQAVPLSFVSALGAVGTPDRRMPRQQVGADQPAVRPYGALPGRGTPHGPHCGSRIGSPQAAVGPTNDVADKGDDDDQADCVARAARPIAEPGHDRLPPLSCRNARS
jgi:hypothetical protein